MVCQTCGSGYLTPDSAAVVLGKAVLWMLVSPESLNFCVPGEYMESVTTEWQSVSAGVVVNGADGLVRDPIKRVPIFVRGNHGQVFMDEIPTLGDAEATDEGQGGLVRNAGAVGGAGPAGHGARGLEGEGSKITCWQYNRQ